MLFSQTELQLLESLGRGIKKISQLAITLNKSQSQIYRIAQKLQEKEILTLSRGIITPQMKTHMTLLLQILTENPNLVHHFSGVGLKLYLCVINPKTIAEIEKETKLHRTTIFKIIKKGRKASLFSIENNTYRVNEKIWPKAREFLIELKKYEASIDKRVPVSSVIYFKNDKEILFSDKDEIDAQLTAFSAYGNYGIDLLLINYYYYLPKKSLSKEEIFKHSLYITEKDNDFRHILFIALFYLKFKDDLKHIEHSILEKLERVFKGEKIKWFPSLEEIKDRADVYNIEV